MAEGKPGLMTHLMVSLFALGMVAGGSYGAWSLLPGDLVTAPLCVRSIEIETHTRTSRRGMRFTSKEFQLQGVSQRAIFYYNLGTIFVDDKLPEQIQRGACYRVEVRRSDYEAHLNRPVSAGYGLRRRYPYPYGRTDLPKVKMFSLALGETVLFTPFDAYGWPAAALASMALFGLVLLAGMLRATSEDG